ncbi:MAG: aminodeoxychorismate synthase component I [Chloroflexi bacterium]|nr:aminodeoxychorismate synthase component I [Chloroflexota bacterium]
MPQVALSAVPDLLALHAADPARYPYLLQTAGAQGGWDILFAFPQRVRRFALGEAGALDALAEEWTAAGGMAADSSGLPFHGGWFLYLGYELLQEIEPSISARPADSAFPIAVMARVPAAVLVDRRAGRAFLLAEEGHESCLGVMSADLARSAQWAPRAPRVGAVEEDPPQQFLDGVARIKHYIREGDVFQVNLARRWQASLGADVGASDLYHALTRHNPAPFGGIADFGDCAIVSSSPERLVRVQGRAIDTRPIAGTRPRAADVAQDNRLRDELLATAKERAEHIMLVDLERNDLGRVCEPGSVEVSALLELASYAHVHHLESTVRGRLRAGIGPVDVIRALFPGGTITGCPKVRCMQIIRELETAPRLAYTGSMGYLNRDGSLDLNILIRSFMLRDQRLAFWAGAGIVADSVAERELEETRAKAKGLLRALGLDQGVA